MDPSCACLGPCEVDLEFMPGYYSYRCQTHPECPNADEVDGGFTVACSDSVQSCSKFHVNRVCAPTAANASGGIDPCQCTGQVRGKRNLPPMAGWGLVFSRQA